MPLKSRLQRLYASRSSAEHMRWHYEHRREDDVLYHPSDGAAWKHFNLKYPEFAAESQNVRLGLCAEENLHLSDDDDDDIDDDEDADD